MSTHAEIEKFYKLPLNRLSQIKGNHKNGCLSCPELIRVHELTGMTTEYLRQVKGAKLYDFLVGYYEGR